MKHLREELDRLLNELPRIVNGLGEAEFIRKPSSAKWSKQEILGHLCDSAANNHVRFVWIMTSEAPITVEGYPQDEWVKLHDYQHGYARPELLALWKLLNGQIRNVLQSATAPDWRKRCLLSAGGELTLAELFEDYLRHMEHHLDQLREIG
ncbi:DinB family protein [Paenibacillus macerans]|uniref:DinB family protein n=1 Tax=Paenibacillus macerans TaxID=44252 RepID=UPI003D321DCB